MVIADTLLIATVVGAIAAVVAAALTVWAALRRFRPKIRARIDERRQAIRLDIRNKGGASGQISDLAVIDTNHIDLDPEFFGLADGHFRSARLEPHHSYKLIIRARKESGEFPPNVRVRIGWGKGKIRDFFPTQIKGISYYGPMERSEWPEGH
jgi:hypothetical protein